MSFDINQLIADLTAVEGQEKSASEVNVASTPEPTVADELRDVLMTKSASESIQDAASLGRALAQRLLTKQASVTGTESLEVLAVAVEDQLSKEAEESQPNVAAGNNAATAGEQQAVNHAAEQSGGTVEQQTEETIKKGLDTPSATATSEDVARRVEDKAEDANMLKAAALMELVTQGQDFYDAADAVYMADSELQKEAAYAQLVSEGMSFEAATALIKQASEAEFVEPALTKEAAFKQLLDQGYTFEQAVEAVSA